jgi:hypothetical protein
MPVAGEFHDKFWRAKANAPPVVAAAAIGGYPLWQASVLTVAIFGPPLDRLRHWADQSRRWLQRTGRRIQWSWWIARRVWTWRVWAEQIAPTPWSTRLDALDLEQLAVLERVIRVMQSHDWSVARQRVRICASTLGFHDPQAWIQYSRLIKTNPGQAQNVFRHLKVVYELTQADPTLTNPDAHLLAELGYQGFMAQGRAGLRT